MEVSFFVVFYFFLRSAFKMISRKLFKYSPSFWLFFLRYDFCSNNDNSKTVQAVTLILARNGCSSQCAASQPLSVFIASNSPWSTKAFHNTLRLLSVAYRTPFSKVKSQMYYLTGPEGMQKTTANNRTHTDGKIHVYTDMHVGHVPDVVLRLSCTGGGKTLESTSGRDIRPQTLWHDS